MNETILLYEELSFNAHPAFQTVFYDGWVLRFADGYDKRTNSVSPLYPSRLDMRDKITEGENLYAARGLPPVFKLTDGADPAMDRLLAERGYAVVTPTQVMAMDIHEKNFPMGDCVVTDHADDEWFNANFAVGHGYDEAAKARARRIVGNIVHPVLCGRLVKDGADVACGMAVIERGYMALLNVAVDEPKRGRGYGTEICASLLSAAKEAGAHTAYLQVVRDNRTAVNLYAKLGYQMMYTYWYRVKGA